MSDDDPSKPEEFQHKVPGGLGDEVSYAPSITLTAEEAAEENRRRAARKSYDVAVFVRAEDVDIIGLCGDISDGGLFVTTHEKLERGTRVQLEVLLPESSDEIVLEAEVRWTREPPDEHTEDEADDASTVVPGFGVKFLDLDDRDREHIEQIMDAVEEARA